MEEPKAGAWASEEPIKQEQENNTQNNFLYCFKLSQDLQIMMDAHQRPFPMTFLYNFKNNKLFFM